MERRIVAVPWFRRDDYDEIRRIMSDGDSLDPLYDDWLKWAEADERKAKIHDIDVARVMIEPYEFEVWCAASGMETDRFAREQFAEENSGHGLK